VAMREFRASSSMCCSPVSSRQPQPPFSQSPFLVSRAPFSRGDTPTRLNTALGIFEAGSWEYDGSRRGCLTPLGAPSANGNSQAPTRGRARAFDEGASPPPDFKAAPLSAVPETAAGRTSRRLGNQAVSRRRKRRIGCNPTGIHERTLHGQTLGDYPLPSPPFLRTNFCAVSGHLGFPAGLATI
jgi:hypothetical protein